MFLGNAGVDARRKKFGEIVVKEIFVPVVSLLGCADDEWRNC